MIVRWFWRQTADWQWLRLAVYCFGLWLVYLWALVNLLPETWQWWSLGIWLARWAQAAWFRVNLRPVLNRNLPRLFWWLIPGGNFYWLLRLYFALEDNSQKHHSFTQFWWSMLTLGWVLPLDLLLSWRAWRQLRSLRDNNPDYLPEDSLTFKQLEPARRSLALLNLRLSLILVVFVSAWWWLGGHSSQWVGVSREREDRYTARLADLEAVAVSLQNHWQLHRSWPTDWSLVAATTRLGHYSRADINPTDLTGQPAGRFLTEIPAQFESLPNPQADQLVVWLGAGCSQSYKLPTRVEPAAADQVALTYWNESYRAGIISFFEVGCREVPATRQSPADQAVGRARRSF